MTSRLAVQVWEVGILWLLERILSVTIINSQTFLGRKSRKIWNRDLSIVHVEVPVGSRKLIYWYAIVRILTSFSNFFPSSSRCLQTISLRTTSSPLCLTNTAEADASFPITLVFLSRIKRNYLFRLHLPSAISWNKWGLVYHFTWEFVFNHLCLFGYY